MKRTFDELKEINSVFESMINFCAPHLNENREETILSDERIKEIVEEEEEYEYVEFIFPGEYEATEIDVDYLLSLKDEIKTIQIIDNTLIKTELGRYYIVSADNFEQEYILGLEYDLAVETENYTISLANESIITGMAATKLEEFDDDWGTVNQYLTLTVHYKNSECIFEKDVELAILDSFIFEVADTTGIAISFSEIRDRSDDLYKLVKDIEERGFYKLRDLEPQNEAMNFFVSAIQTNDPELKFLNFYKVLEHFSPIAVNIEANELMRKKLDAPKSSFEDGDYIRSIFALANSMKNKFNDEDLIKASFNTCFDFIGLFEDLPASVKKKIKNHLKMDKVDYDTDKQKITTACNIAGKIIFKTRNKVVHAKSNFQSTGEEIDISEFSELNSFMKIASSQAIRWYSRQPMHLKSDIIK